MMREIVHVICVLLIYLAGNIKIRMRDVNNQLAEMRSKDSVVKLNVTDVGLSGMQVKKVEPLMILRGDLV